MTSLFSSQRAIAYSGSFIFVFLSLILWYASPEKDQHFDLDSYGYERIALNGLNSMQWKDPADMDIPVQAIGYPIIIALIYAFFGAHYQIALVLQVMLALITCFLIWSSARQLFGDQVGRLAFLMSCINVGFLVFAQFFLTEICAVFLLALFFERTIIFVKEGATSALLVAGTALGLCTIIKPTPLLFIPIFLGLLWTAPSIEMPRALLLKMIFLIFFPLTILIAHNYYQYGFAQIAPTAQENIYYYFLAKLKKQNDLRQVEEIYREIESTFGSYKRSDARRWQKAKSEFFNFVKEKPFVIIRLWAESAAKTIGGLHTSQLKLLLNQNLKKSFNSFFGAPGKGIQKINNYIMHGARHSVIWYIGWAEFIFNSARYIFILFALVILFFQKEYWIVLFFILYCGYFIGVTGHDGCARYRLVIEPMLTIFASFGILRIREFLKRPRLSNVVLIAVDN